MKNSEELARLIIKDRIQAGLREQEIQRAFSTLSKSETHTGRSGFPVKTARWFFAGVFVLLLFLIGRTAFASEQANIARLRAATAKFHRTHAAEEAGYGLVPGLDHCFENPGVSAMGYHYINTSILDLSVDELQPEAMVYIPGPNGVLQLGAVEYIVPAAMWDAAGNNNPPAVLGQSFHINQELGVYILHAWIWKNNPAGMFEDWNPKVSCP